MSSFQPPPTYALPILVDEKTGKATFNPIWLKWFVDLSANLGSGGAGTVTSVNVSGGSTGLTASGGPVSTTGIITLAAPALTTTGLLTAQGGAQFMRTNTALTNSAAAQVATMTNGPTAGNPTKWVGINDNGTVRQIPVW